MSTAFDNLIADIEREARDEGPRAVRELESLRREFALAAAQLGNNLGNKLSKTEDNSGAKNPANTGTIA